MNLCGVAFCSVCAGAGVELEGREVVCRLQEHRKRIGIAEANGAAIAGLVGPVARGKQ